MAGRQVDKCTHCGLILLAPRGPVNANILCVGDWPDWLDIKKGVHYCTDGWKTRVGDVLKEEFKLAGINPGRVKLTNVWQHAQNKNCSYDFHKTQFFKEILGAKYILLMGSTPLELLAPGKKVSEWSGLEIISTSLPNKGRAMAIIKPTIALGDTLGEVRFAIRNFAEMVHE
jgi:hypothetical protein